MNQPRRPGVRPGESEIVSQLREAAQQAQKLHEAHEELKQRYTVLQQQHASLQEWVAQHENVEEQFEEWQELLLNFKSGIVDEGELIAGTVGRVS